MKNGLLSTASARAQHLSLVIYRGAHKAKYITCCKKASMQMSFVSVSHLHCCITYAQPVHHRRGVCWLHMLLLLTARRQWALSAFSSRSLGRVCIFRRSAHIYTQHAYSSAYIRMRCAQRCGEAAGEQSVRCVRAPTRVHMTIKIHQFGCARERN